MHSACAALGLQCQTTSPPLRRQHDDRSAAPPPPPASLAGGVVGVRTICSNGRGSSETECANEDDSTAGRTVLA